MTKFQMDVIRAMAETNGNAAEVARILGKTRNTICYHLDKIHESTKRDPRTFNGLIELIDIVGSGSDLIEDVMNCNICGVELYKQNVVHTRIVTCDGYKEVQCIDNHLCISCSAKLIAFANGNKKRK